jgi:beta-phosphoglucomutase family hydrolase
MTLDLLFPRREFAALLFDFDGTVADTMPGHLLAWNAALSLYGLQLSREQHHAWAGRPTREIVEILSRLHGKELSLEKIAAAKETSYATTVDAVKAILPVAEIIQDAYRRVPMAVVSGSRRKPVERTLEHLGMAKYFQALVCAEDYVHGKPAPEPFLKAASLLAVKPQDCLVFEDAELGLQGAKAAGMACVHVQASEDGAAHTLRPL